MFGGLVEPAMPGSSSNRWALTDFRFSQHEEKASAVLSVKQTVLAEAKEQEGRLQEELRKDVGLLQEECKHLQIKWQEARNQLQQVQEDITEMQVGRKIKKQLYIKMWKCHKPFIYIHTHIYIYIYICQINIKANPYTGNINFLVFFFQTHCHRAYIYIFIFFICAVSTETSVREGTAELALCCTSSFFVGSRETT